MNDEADQLSLPHGAFIAFRQSGGLRFSTREIIVYDDGFVIVRRQGKLDAGEGSRRITPDEVAGLKEQIDRCALFGLHPPIGRQNPDGYTYELIVRMDRKSKLIEFFDGSIPAEIQPLLAHLKTLATIDDAHE